jgi:hypothetical protein
MEKFQGVKAEEDDTRVRGLISGKTARILKNKLLSG